MPELATKEYCTGCTACASACPKGCITMIADKNGFLHPMIDADKCIMCGLCEKCCPVISPLKISEAEPRVYAAFSRDERMRLESSSGGVFTELARSVLKDGGVVFGAAYTTQFEVAHVCVEGEADLALLRGAKYAQSDLRGVFVDVKSKLKEGWNVLFSGTPCQVAGLKAFLGEEYDALLTVDFICHSVPSPKAWQEYTKYRAGHDNSGKLPCDINLRSKHSGWTNYQYSNLFTYADGHAYSVKSSESLYMKLFVGGYINRESCAKCQFKGYNRVSDLTIGDFWGIWDIAPEMDDNKGTSVVLVQSRQGAEQLRRVSGQLILKAVTLEEASRQNGAMLRASQPNVRRTEAFNLIQAGEIGECEKWFVPAEFSILKQVHRALGGIFRKLGILVQTSRKK